MKNWKYNVQIAVYEHILIINWAFNVHLIYQNMQRLSIVYWKVHQRSFMNWAHFRPAVVTLQKNAVVCYYFMTTLDYRRERFSVKSMLFDDNNVLKIISKYIKISYISWQKIKFVFA